MCGVSHCSKVSPKDAGAPSVRYGGRDAASVVGERPEALAEPHVVPAVAVELCGDAVLARRKVLGSYRAEEEPARQESPCVPHDPHGPARPRHALARHLRHSVGLARGIAKHDVSAARLLRRRRDASGRPDRARLSGKRARELELVDAEFVCEMQRGIRIADSFEDSSFFYTSEVRTAQK